MSPDFTIPASLRSVDASLEGWPRERRYCWECGATAGVTESGRMARCGGCRASERQQMREDAYRETHEREDDDE